MSRNWAGGSTTAWRRVRAFVLDRDEWLCQIQLTGCAIRANEAHHILGRSVSGDDPDYIVAACRHCNLAIGEPVATKAGPELETITKW